MKNAKQIKEEFALKREKHLQNEGKLEAYVKTREERNTRIESAVNFIIGEIEKNLEQVIDSDDYFENLVLEVTSETPFYDDDIFIDIREMLVTLGYDCSPEEFMETEQNSFYTFYVNLHKLI